MARSTRSTRTPQRTQDVKGIAVPAAAAQRILAAVDAAQNAQAHANGIIEAVMAALGAAPGSQLVQTQGDERLYFMPPAAEAAQDGQAAQGEAKDG